MTSQEPTAPMGAYRAVLLVEGESIQQIARRLDDLAYRLQDRHREAPVLMVGGNHIVSIRSEDTAARVDWRDAAPPQDRGCRWCQADPGEFCVEDCGGPAPRLHPDYVAEADAHG